MVNKKMSQKDVAKAFQLRDNCYIEESDFNDGGGIVYIKQNHPIQNFFRRISFKIPEVKQLELDAFGYFVIKQIANKENKNEIIDNLELKFGDSIQPTQERLDIFLKQLENMRIITVAKN